MGRFTRAIGAAGVVAVLLAGCSSSAKPEANPDKILTKAEYIKAADAICKTYGNRISGVVSSAGSVLTVAESKDVWQKKLIPLFQAERKELLRLRPPKADAKELSDALIAMNSGINTIIGRVGSATSIADLNAMQPHGIAAWHRAAGQYGMKVCGSKATG